jgi:diguanylate cyclase (GGDEF)-like protein
MPENVAILLAVLVAANVVLVVVALWRNRAQRRRLAGHDAAIDAIVATPVGHASAGPRPFVGGPGTAADAATRMPPSRTDALTETLLPGEWNRILADEDARLHRYRRPATVALIELDGLDPFVSALGKQAGDRVLVAVADTLKRHARSSDHVARLGPGRFGLLLPETGEVEAVNLVERLRALCDLWLESGSIGLRLAIGWASPAIEGSLAEAYDEAAERMYAELRRNERLAARSDDEPEAAGEFEGAASPA